MHVCRYALSYIHKNRVDMTRVDATLKKAPVPGSDVENVTLLIFNSRAVTSLSPPTLAQG